MRTACGISTGVLSVLTGVVSMLIGVPHAWGATITAENAQKAAGAWITLDARPLGTQIGAQASQVTSYPGMDKHTAYYVVSFQPSGFVILPADDLIEPIICFASAGTYDASDTNPLGALVSRDVHARTARAQLLQEQQNGGNAVQRVPTDAQAKWQRLLTTADVRAQDLYSLSDLRVAPLIQSQWAQETECGSLCYNYYTPDHYPCGCAATAQAQLMRLYQYPTAGPGVAAFTISVDGASRPAHLRGGDGFGGPYNWASMVLDPDCSTTDTQRSAIGALCFDAGISLEMRYRPNASGIPTLLRVASSLKSTFGYTHAVCGGGTSNNNIGSGLNGMIDPNLDAGYPVLLGIRSDEGGHAVIADGYGFQYSTLYHHLNMGWSGSEDAWYNLPDIDSSYPGFDVVSDCVYNVYVAGSGEIISGRVLDVLHEPLSGAVVSASASGGGVYTATTNAKGIYALAKVPSNSSYTLNVTAAGHTFVTNTVNTGMSTDGATISGNVGGVDFVEPDPNYCDADGGSDEYISGVQVGSINNTGTTSGGYMDYTSLSTTMEAGASYAITITNGNPYSSDQCGIWVDWNQDRDFDDTNETVAVSGNPSEGPYTAIIIPPVEATAGPTRMRVRITYTGAVEPCGQATYGEVEDYTINVNNSSAAAILQVSPAERVVGCHGGPTSFVVSNAGSGMMNWTATTPATPTNWLHVLSPGNGTNSGSIQVTCDANPGAQRQGTIAVTAAGATGSPVSVVVTQQMADVHVYKAAICDVDSTVDADHDGYYEQYSFDIAIDADAPESTANVRANILCLTTGQSWTSTEWTTSGLASDYRYFSFTQADFAGHLSGNASLDFAVELYSSDLSVKYETEDNLSGEPFYADWIPPPPDTDGDGVTDARDGCPNDSGKTAPGACGCSVPEGTCTYALRVEVPSGASTSESYLVGTVVSIDAPVAPEGQHFSHWSGDASGSDDPLQVVMDRDKFITANYEACPIQQTTPCAPGVPVCGLATMLLLGAMKVRSRRYPV